MGYKSDEVIALAKRGLIPRYLLASWEASTGEDPLHHAEKIQTKRNHMFVVTLLAAFAIAAFSVLAIVMHTHTINPGTVNSFAAVIMAIFMLTVVAWMRWASTEDNYARSKKHFGRDFWDLIELAQTAHVNRDPWRDIKNEERFKTLVYTALRIKAVQLKRAQDARMRCRNRGHLERRSERLDEALDLAVRFGLADAKVNWPLLFKEEQRLDASEPVDKDIFHHPV